MGMCRGVGLLLFIEYLAVACFFKSHAPQPTAGYWTLEVEKHFHNIVDRTLDRLGFKGGIVHCGAVIRLV